MNSISIKQAISIWIDLEDALNGDNGYGGHVAEIYAHRLMPSCPSFSINPFDPLTKDYHLEICADAAEALVGLCKMFETQRKCGIEIDEMDPDQWLKEHGTKPKNEAFAHRCHVKVTKK